MVTAYRFDRFELQPDQRRLLMDGHPVALGDRAFDVLVALVERTGQLVNKDELLGLVWPDLVVEENNLQVQVSSLRKILGAAAIATAPGRGYRFALPLVPAGDSSPPPIAQRHNLPPQLTSFIGHEDDLNECLELLDQTRLLTFIGIGGCGKTRLAIKLAERALPSFPDGVWYVDLAPLLDAERVALTVATALGIEEESDRPIVDTLCARLSSQCALLILDNCEHLVAPCAALVRSVVSAAAGVRVLAASREGLGVPGERVVPVRSLRFPPAGPHELRTLESCEAVRLFVERAHMSIAKFSLTDETAYAVTEICRRLDGIPLAIELAAARVKMLSVEEIRVRLDDRFRLLRGGSRTAMARQQTLLAAIQWSYDHLSSDEQRLLRGLSVFVGGWTLSGAARVCGDRLDEYEVLDGLTRLVDQSLVATRRIEGDTTRYSMLETVRQYAQDRLNEASEGESTRNRHLVFYVALAEAAEPELVGREQRAWFARLDLERENLLTAHAWCDHAEGGAELGLRLVFSLRYYFPHRGLTTLAHRITVEALARPRAQGRNLARCRALWAAGQASYFMGRYDETKDCAETSLSISREIGNKEMEAESLRLLGFVMLAEGNRVMARAHLQDTLALARQLEDKQYLSRALNGLGVFHSEKRELQKAQRFYEEALEVSRGLGDRGGTAIELANLAWIFIQLDSADRARELMSEGLAIATEIGSKRAAAPHMGNAMQLAACFGDWKFAARLHGATEALLQQMGHRREPDEEAANAPSVARTREALGAAAFAAAASAGRALTNDEAIAEARAWLESHS